MRHTGVVGLGQGDGGGRAAAGVSPALRVVDLHKRFGRLDVLRGVDIDVQPGEIVALVGENGAGKSTVVQCVARSCAPDRGRLEVAGRPLAPDPLGARDQGVAVVWQNLALCDNLSVVANLFLGDERLGGRLLDEAAMVAEARALFEGLHIATSDLQRPVGALSGGQRQLVAIARAVRRRPSVLVLDEPTASLGVQESAVVERLLAELRAGGTAILLVSHRLEQVFTLADRIAIVRHGRIVANVSPLEVHPDDVVALISGIETDSTAHRQLQRLRSLVEQLTDVGPAGSLPLIVSAMAEALGVDQLCVHLLDRTDGADDRRLRRSAAVGLAPALLRAIESLPVDAAGGPPGRAAASGEAVLVEDVRLDGWWAPLGTGDPQLPRSTWSVPIVGASGVLGTVSGYADTVGALQSDQLELVWLYASHAAAAIERERLLAEATRRNRVLETLRGVLDTLAGPQPPQGGLGVALIALGRGLGADAIALHDGHGKASEFAVTDLGEGGQPSSAQRAAAATVIRAPARLDRARPIGDDVLAVPIATPAGRVVVTAWWADVSRLSNDALDLLDDAARSLHLALEREALEEANAEAASLRRSQLLQRDFLFRLNHELRTPLTAIQGYASTLRQPDVSWDPPSQQRFLDSIAAESRRMGRLVGDLLDFSAIDSGTLRLVRDWCSLDLVVEAARRCVSGASAALIQVADCSTLPPVWADHDRLEQVFVNLLDNAVRHAEAVTSVAVSGTFDPAADTVTVRVVDDGVGIGPDLAARVFLPHERGAGGGQGAGLGLAIARGIIEAHGGTIALDRVERGTSMSVTIPVEPSAQDDDPAARAPALPTHQS
jgi:signal transduction histidine kinase/ABC-type branched-subunit amino acid transport system ATPase component